VSCVSVSTPEACSILPVVAEAYIELAPNPPEQSSSSGVFPLTPPTLVYDQMTKSQLFSFSVDLESTCNTLTYGLPERTLSQATRDDFIWSLSWYRDKKLE
jgi:hypothetical protein